MMGPLAYAAGAADGSVWAYNFSIMHHQHTRMGPFLFAPAAMVLLGAIKLVSTNSLRLNGST